MEQRKNIPENYQAVMPYLILKNADGFLRFTKDVFNAKETNKTMRDENVIRHAEVMIGGSTIMFAEATETFESNTAGLFIYVDNADITYAKAIENGATKITGLSDQSYGRSGGVKDAFGNTWWITSVL